MNISSNDGIVSRMIVRFRTILTVAVILAGAALPALSQDLEPRRWSHLPVGTSFAGGGYAYTSGEIAFDPVLQIEDVDLDLHTAAVSYIHSFELFGRSARIDITQAYQDARWRGLLNGVPAASRRSGFSDSMLRFSTNLFGAPPLEGKDFADYRKEMSDAETIVGAGLALHLPTGNYLSDNLLNLGSNRFTFRPQLGVVHNRGPWSMELTGASWIFTENDEFFAGNRLEQDPLFTLQTHLVYTFRPGFWIGTGLAYGGGLESTINGIGKDDRRANVAFGASIGYPINPKFGIKIGYIGLRSQESVGADLDTVTAGFSVLW